MPGIVLFESPFLLLENRHLRLLEPNTRATGHLVRLR